MAEKIRPGRLSRIGKDPATTGRNTALNHDTATRLDHPLLPNLDNSVDETNSPRERPPPLLLLLPNAQNQPSSSKRNGTPRPSSIGQLDKHPTNPKISPLLESTPERIDRRHSAIAMSVQDRSTGMDLDDRTESERSDRFDFLLNAKGDPSTATIATAASDRRIAIHRLRRDRTAVEMEGGGARPVDEIDSTTEVLERSRGAGGAVREDGDSNAFSNQQFSITPPFPSASHRFSKL